MTPDMITGVTQFYAMVGHPVAQVRMPTALNTWLAENGIDGVMATFDIRPDSIETFFAMLKGWQNCRGAGVTVPHKQAAFLQCDATSERAVRIGAVNVVRREPDGRLFGDMTDGEGFLFALGGHGVSVEDKRVVLVGAGGAGSAIADAVAGGCAARLAVLDIDETRRDDLMDALQATYPDVEVTEDAGDPSDIDILVNATPMGMRPDDPLPFPLDGIGPPTVVADAVTKPVTTRFLEAAQTRGCVIQRGHEMAEAQLPMFLNILDAAGSDTKNS